MSTEFKTTQDGEVVAKRFFAGKRNGGGAVVQMEVTEREFAAFADMEVADEGGNVVGTFREFVDRMETEGVAVRWDSAARRNETARRFEEWVVQRAGDAAWTGVVGAVEAAAVETRVQARGAARDAMRVV